MKRRFLSAICIFITILMACTMFFVGCGEDGNGPEDTAPKEYIIQYADENGTHQITVKNGMPYYLDAIPKKNGYTFTGLYDAKVGGTQYISEDGLSLSPFTDNKNLVLFPQFRAKEYTLFLDFQGAQVTGAREYSVSYGERLPELPKNVSLEHNEFVGWFTQAQNQGKQVADEYGLLAKTSYVNETNFDLSDDFIYLYAGFEKKKYTVTFCFEAGMDTEEVEVPYDTPISEVIPDTRVNGKAVLTWAKTQGGEAFKGRVTDDLVLYATEYAPVIEFDSNGGNSVNAIVARAGDAINIPVPTRENYKFVCWQTTDGTTFSATNMPAETVRVKAKWQAMIIFDSNGGTEVSDISEPQGTAVALPVTEREGYIFAGWYTEDKQEVDLAAMPSESICLKAGWYEISASSFYLINEKSGLLIAPSMAEIEDDYRDSLGWYYSYYRKLDLSEILNGQTLSLEIKFTATLYSRFTGSNADINIDLFSAPSPSSTYLLHSVSANVKSQDRKQISWDVKVQTNRDLYVCYYKSGSQTFINNLHCEVIYPNLNDLYL